MGINFVDNTGKLVSAKDVQEALDTVRKYLVVGMLQLPPELAIQLPNIARCLQELAASK